eukprot:sb/3473181/
MAYPAPPLPLHACCYRVDPSLVPLYKGKQRILQKCNEVEKGITFLNTISKQSDRTQLAPDHATNTTRATVRTQTLPSTHLLARYIQTDSQSVTTHGTRLHTVSETISLSFLSLLETIKGPTSYHQTTHPIQPRSLKLSGLSCHCQTSDTRYKIQE